jgi:hypothetical protein
MPLTNKGEKIKGAMEKEYGAEKGEKIFYASKNKGVISGVDAMAYGHPVVEVAKRMSDMVGRMDAFISKRMKRGDTFEEPKHPRNAGGVFTPAGEEGKEEKTDKAKKDQDLEQRPELREGALSKK